MNYNAIVFNERPRRPLTYAVIAVNSVEDFVAGLFIGEIVGTDAAKDGRLSQCLPGGVAGLSAMLDHSQYRLDPVSGSLYIEKQQCQLQDTFSL